SETGQESLCHASSFSQRTTGSSGTCPAETLLGDVATVVHAFEMNVGNGLVGGKYRRFEVRSGRGDTQDTAAGRFQTAVEVPGTGVEDGRAGAVGDCYPFDLFAGFVSARVAAAGEDYADAGAGFPFDGVSGEVPFRGGQQDGQEVAGHSMHEG